MKFKLNERVYIKGVNKKGVVKEVYEEDDTYKVTFFQGENNRKVDLFSEKDLRKWKPNKANKYYHMVKEFHQKFGHPAPNKPTALTKEYALSRAAWIGEEIIELLHASATDKYDFYSLYDELLNRMNETSLKLGNKEIPKDTVLAQVDAFIDIDYFANGGYTEMGIKPDKLFESVHNANMRKLWDDGKPHYNDQGKIVKPEGWTSPDEDIKKEIERQMKGRK